MKPCAACGEPLDFVKTATRKWMPVEGDAPENWCIMLNDPSGQQVTIVTETGAVFKGRMAASHENGTTTVRGRQAHWGNCTHAEQFRKDGNP